jgi:DNA-binding MarR family transcriptional regulator
MLALYNNLYIAINGGVMPEAVSTRSVPADADAGALADELVRMARLFERVRADFATRCRDGLERAATALLASLVADGPRRLSELAEAVHSDPSTVSRQVAHLVRSGLVARHPDPRDGRAALLTATEAGRRVFAEHRRVRDCHTAAVLADWSAEDVHRLVHLLGRLNTDIERYRALPATAGESTGLTEQEGRHS